VWGCDRPDVRGDFVEGAFRTGDDLVGAQAFEDFREFVEVATNDDGGFFVAVARALGDQESRLEGRTTAASSSARLDGRKVNSEQKKISRYTRTSTNGNSIRDSADQRWLAWDDSDRPE